METLGSRLKELRSEKNITREEICGTGEVLSPKQLYRIEANQSTPSIEKVVYLAQQLGVTLGELFEENMGDLPAEYRSKKYEIISTQILENHAIIEKVLKDIESLKKTYESQLPEDEVVVLEALDETIRLYIGEVAAFKSTDQIKQQLRLWVESPYFDINALTMIKVLLIRESIYYQKYKKSLFGVMYVDHIIHQLMVHTPVVTKEDWFLCRDDLIMGVTYYLILDNGRKEACLDMLALLKEFNQRFQDHQKKFIPAMLAWKVSLFLERDLEKAKLQFEQAKAFLVVLEDPLVLEKLTEEWEKDQRRFQAEYEI